MVKQELALPNRVNCTMQSHNASGNFCVVCELTCDKRWICDEVVSSVVGFMVQDLWWMQGEVGDRAACEIPMWQVSRLQMLWQIANVVPCSSWCGNRWCCVTWVFAGQNVVHTNCVPALMVPSTLLPGCVCWWRHFQAALNCHAFTAVCVNWGHCIASGDVENACQQSPPPANDCFLEIDNAICDWHFHKFGEGLNKQKDVIPLHCALQGHPEASVLWEHLIIEILIDKMGFCNTIHERNIHSGAIDGKDMLVCCQFDDFAVGAESPDAAELFIAMIREHIQAAHAVMGIETKEGLCQ